MSSRIPEVPSLRASVFIIGSCVTRDAFELPGHGYTIADYVARSSFACSTRRHPFPLGIDRLDPTGAVDSNWQRRMVEIDLSRGLLPRLRAVEKRGGPGGRPRSMGAPAKARHRPFVGRIFRRTTLTPQPAAAFP